MPNSPTTKQTTIKQSPEEQAALAFILEQRPELKTEAAARRTSIIEYARKLGWKPGASPNGTKK